MNESSKLFVPNRSAGSSLNLSLNGADISLVWCPPGDFIMGSSPAHSDDSMLNETPHQVTFTGGFWISRTPVTQGMWKGVTGRYFRVSHQSDIDLLPVEAVSWDTAIDFCSEATRRLHLKQRLTGAQRILLPTEAQWEYACRAGTTTRWYFGNEQSNLSQHAWYQANSEDEPHSVGLKLPNSWGIYDLYGNVAEWCLDTFHTYEPVKAVDPCYLQGDGELRIIRGGDYTCPARDCQSSSRRPLLKNNPFAEETGLRVVCVE